MTCGSSCFPIPLGRPFETYRQVGSRRASSGISIWSSVLHEIRKQQCCSQGQQDNAYSVTWSEGSSSDEEREHNVQFTPARVRVQRRTVQSGFDVSLRVGCDLPVSRLNIGTFYVSNPAVPLFCCFSRHNGGTDDLWQKFDCGEREMELVRNR